jgi:Fur family peroxide stress response transcriptional regulator
MESLPLDHRNLRTILEQAGMRCTPQRLAVYDQLSQSSEHPTAEDIYQSVRSSLPKISLATVYKALEAWVAVGLATKLTAGSGGTCARYDARQDLHYHFRCLRSGTVHDLPTRFDPDLITKLDPRLHEELGRRGFQVTGYRLELVGYETTLAAGTVHPDQVEPAEAAHDLAATKLPAGGAANP